MLPLRLITVSQFLCFNVNLFGKKQKFFYDTLGEWSGIYTMKPVRLGQDKVGVCHIKYFYTPAKGSYAVDTGYDFRIFYYTLDNKTCKWKVVRMNTYMSGFLAYD